ncbi:hypothetical protein CVU75_03095 [Candidatus Dependentiae bacterium HGW-Dependentiae-1]|nr:MAG: hypothetical protein CVU75_03095 [Candidatus Dependentiae bacterium HGW-Dependentiae-1]
MYNFSIRDWDLFAKGGWRARLPWRFAGNFFLNYYFAGIFSALVLCVTFCVGIGFLVRVGLLCLKYPMIP